MLQIYNEICGVFNDATNVSGCKALNDKMNNELGGSEEKIWT